MTPENYAKLYANLPDELRNEFCRIVIAKHGTKNQFTMTQEIESALKNWIKSPDECTPSSHSTSEKLKLLFLEKRISNKWQKMAIAAVSPVIIAMTSYVLPPEALADLWDLFIITTTDLSFP